MPGAYLAYFLAGALLKRTPTIVHNIQLLQTLKTCAYLLQSPPAGSEARSHHSFYYVKGFERRDRHLQAYWMVRQSRQRRGGVSRSASASCRLRAGPGGESRRGGPWAGSRVGLWRRTGRCTTHSRRTRCGGPLIIDLGRLVVPEV